MRKIWRRIYLQNRMGIVPEKTSKNTLEKERNDTMWAYESVFYQIYPIGFCGAPDENDGVLVPRIRKVMEWSEHIAKVGANAVYFSPIFESDRHGYDTRDYTKVDCRLGTNEDFADVCKSLHDAGVKVVLDGVFNHVGRGFFGFKDVQEKKWDSKYKDWFHINFDGNSCYDDGFWYEGWEGHFELVKLNLRNPEVVNYLLSCIDGWVKEFDIDGIRLDVAYLLDQDFLRTLRTHCNNLKEDFVLIGELLHGDYNMFVAEDKLHSCTNYECYKGLYSSFNSMNMFEITHSLLRQFGPENWTLYRGKHLLCFVDNHDVSRVASILTNKAHLPLIYGMLFGMPGIPCIYYGSEWGAEGEKQKGSDANLRPCFEAPEFNELSQWIAKLAKAHKESNALCYGDFGQVVLTNKQVIFKRETESERVLVAVNADGESFHAGFSDGKGVDLLTGKEYDLGGGMDMEPYSVAYIKMA